MTRWNRALVTGASSGIGRALCERLAADGTRLVVVARDEQRLGQLAARVDVDCEILVADLADPAALVRVEDRLRDDEAGSIDLLVNNAGFGFYGPLHELDLEREAAVVDVNVVAVHRLAQVAAATMVARGGGGGILNVSSMSAFAPTPNNATYAATKAFVNALSEALHAELAEHHVHVTALCPGFTRTEFQARADLDASSIPDRLWQDADEVAAAGLWGIDQNRAVVVPGVLNKVGAGLVNSLPGTVRRFVLPKIQL
jgi:short-subunit dehydrogenase